MTGSPGSDAYPPVGAHVVVRLRGRIAAIGPREDVKGVRVALDAEGRQSTVIAAEGCAEIERIAPAEWPPHPGDIWADGDGTEYFFYADTRGDKMLLARTCNGQFIDRWVRNQYSPIPGDRRVEGAESWVLETAPGPLKLRYRPSPVEATQ